MARKQPATKTQPAATKPATQEGVGVKRLAEIVGRTPKSVRASIRRIKGGAQVGQGGRYHWDSEKDPEFMELVAKLTSSTASE